MYTASSRFFDPAWRERPKPNEKPKVLQEALKIAQHNMNNIFIIAEAGVNHNGNLNLAYQLIDAAANANADAVKFQTFKAELVMSKFAEKATYRKENLGTDESQLEMVKKLELKFDDFRRLKEYCDEKNIQFLTTPFDYESADFVDNLIDLYKVPSGEITNLPFLKHLAEKNKPIILSTGMCNLGEVENAINIIKSASAPLDSFFPSLTLLHCTSNYPTAYEDVNLNVINTLRSAFGLPVGYSDHTMGICVPIAAAAMGATVIEKHFTLDRTMDGPDHKASLEPNELSTMVESIRYTESAMGNGRKQPGIKENEIKQVARKSIVAASDIEKGSIISEDLMTIKRPGNGISPEHLKHIIGMTIQRNKAVDEVLHWQDFRQRK